MKYKLNYYETYVGVHEVEADNLTAAQEKLKEKICLGEENGPEQCVASWCEPDMEEDIRGQISRAMNKTLNLSTGHLTEDTRERLTRCALNNDHIPMCTVYEKSEYGWLVYIDDQDDTDELPADLQDCIRVALAYGANCICFDRDAYELDLLPKYE